MAISDEQRKQLVRERTERERKRLEAEVFKRKLSRTDKPPKPWVYKFIWDLLQELNNG